MAQDWIAYRERMNYLERMYDGRIPSEELDAAYALRPKRDDRQQRAA